VTCSRSHKDSGRLGTHCQTLFNSPTSFVIWWTTWNWYERGC